MILNTYTGKGFDPINPQEDMICLEDIAHALSHLCRWGGHCNRFYSVAEHSVIMARFYIECENDKIRARLALMHDASEAYFNDVPTPVKRLLPKYEKMEEAVQKIVLKKFNLYGDFSMIKEADLRICRNEAKALLDDKVEGLYDIPMLPLRNEPYGWSPTNAKERFLETAEYLNVT